MKLFGIFLTFMLLFNQANACLNVDCGLMENINVSKDVTEDCHESSDHKDHSDQDHCAGHCVHSPLIDISMLNVDFETSVAPINFKYSFNYESRNLESKFQPPKS